MVRLSLVACLLAAPLAAQRAPAPVDRGLEAIQRHELDRAEREFAAAAASADSGQHIGGLRGGALVRWRYRADFAGARRLLGEALASGVDTASTLAALARLALAAGQPGEAVAIGVRAHDAALAADEPDIARLAARTAVLAAVEPTLAAIDRAAPLPDDAAHLDAAVRRLAPLVRATPGRTDDSYALLLGALARGDGPLALEAWRSYYLVDAEAARHGPLVGAERELAAALPRWTLTAPPPVRARVVDALAASGLYVPAALVARAGHAPLSARERDVVVYAAFCRALGRAADEHYRLALLGRARDSDLRRLYVRLTHDLWPRLAWPGGASPRYFPAAADSELSRRFGVVLQFGRTGGFFDLHYGHRVVDETRAVEQYGHRATVRFVALDGMVSDGLQTWAWDGHNAHAGWQVGTLVVQVRPVFAENPIAFWERVTVAHRREMAESEIAADSAADLARVAGAAVAFLPGVAERLVRDGSRAVLDSLRAAGLDGDTLRRVFVDEIARATRTAVVFAHEGRHAIDRRLGIPEDPVELELRAKWSEIAFAQRPRLVLSAIVNASIGDATPHGQANLRALRGVVAWMQRHAGEIPGWDPRAPVLVQLPRLSDAQLREAFRSQDPLARERASAMP